jgi:hypothetical protein
LPELFTLLLIMDWFCELLQSIEDSAMVLMLYQSEVPQMKHTPLAMPIFDRSSCSRYFVGYVKLYICIEVSLRLN